MDSPKNKPPRASGTRGLSIGRQGASSSSGVGGVTKPRIWACKVLNIRVTS